MRVGRIQKIFRYPVKSMAGEVLDEIDLGAGGIPGDRAWAVRDETRGGIRGAKRFPELMAMRANYSGSPTGRGSAPADIWFADGEHATTSDADIKEKLSSRLNSPVTLWPLLPAEDRDHYRRGRPENPDLETELRTIFARTAVEPLPDLSVFPLELMEFESPPGTYFDAFPLLLLTTASLDTMQDRIQGSNFDVRRFRPNFLISEADSHEPFPEFSWVDKSLRMGDATIKITIQCPRCVMVTHGFDNLPRDPGVMRSLVRETGGNMGVYGQVVEPGPVRVGDAVELLE